MRNGYLQRVTGGACLPTTSRVPRDRIAKTVIQTSGRVSVEGQQRCTGTRVSTKIFFVTPRVHPCQST